MHAPLVNGINQNGNAVPLHGPQHYRSTVQFNNSTDECAISHKHSQRRSLLLVNGVRERKKRLLSKLDSCKTTRRNEIWQSQKLLIQQYQHQINLLLKPVLSRKRSLLHSERTHENELQQRALRISSLPTNEEDENINCGNPKLVKINLSRLRPLPLSKLKEKIRMI